MNHYRYQINFLVTFRGNPIRKAKKIKGVYTNTLSILDLPI